MRLRGACCRNGCGIRHDHWRLGRFGVRFFNDKHIREGHLILFKHDELVVLQAAVEAARKDAAAERAAAADVPWCLRAAK